MSTKFLFTAVNRYENPVTERIEAENLSQARYKLEIQGYSEITFYESELTAETDNLFEEKQIKAKDKYLENQVSVQYDTSIKRQFLNVLKASWFFWILIVGSFLYVQNTLTFLILTGSIFLMIYLCIPGIIFHKLHEAHNWNKNKKVIFWIRAARWFNAIAFIKIPNLEIDYYSSCVEAREGKLNEALQIIAKYQNDHKVSQRLLNLKLIGIYANAKDFENVLHLYEKNLRAENNCTEELIDYVACLARRHNQTTLAKNVLEKVFDRELTVMAKLFIPYCQGVIEVEDKNYSQAEFYLKQALKELEPFEKNSYLIGLRSEVKAFLAITLGKLGQKEEAENLYYEAQPYLTAVDETDLIQRCETVLR